MAIFKFVQNENTHENNNAVSRDDKPKVILKTWQDLLDYMDIDPVELPWNSDGVTALRILREKYGAQMRELNDKYLDEVMCNFSACGSTKQLDALGSAMAEIGLNFCEIKLNSHEFLVYVRRESSKSQWNEKWSSIVKRNRPYEIIRSFALSRDESLNATAEDIRIPMTSVQVAGTGLFSRNSSINKSILDHFLIVLYDTYESDREDAVRKMRVYDLRYWPIREIENVHYSYNRSNIEPYSLEIETECGEKYYYVGDQFGWYSTVENSNGERIPVYKDESEKRVWRGPSLGGNQIRNIPEIMAARPLLTIDDCVIYRYTKPDVEHYDPEEKNWTPTMRYLNFSEIRRTRNALIEYNTVTKKYRKLTLPGAYSMRDGDITVYKNTWLVLHESIYHRSPSYLLRFWNPRTNECLRLTELDMGKHQIRSVIPTPNGDVLFLLDDGRLCHPNVDVVAWLKQDLQQHQIALDGWQNEARRAFENFPECSVRSAQLRRWDGTDRMLITFADGTTYDIFIKDKDTQDL